ncbi:MAG TPA: coproporphyrinogen dehydrogenase HemZ [Clostridiales bacterium]|nr:coproporphyrinogen dehydrogenase HemZ [Clostridiales bacterium]
MLNTNSEYLKPEIMDVIRAFGCEDKDFGHYFSFGSGKFFNAVECDGEFYDFENECEVEGDLEFKRLAKRFAKLAFYNVLSKRYGRLPWGALTGIRPTKLAYAEISAGRDFKNLFKQMDVSEANTLLVEKTIAAQKGIYDKGGGQDLFISIPFCPTKCEYCSFITAPITATKKYVDEYIDCLIGEIRSVKPLVKKLNSVYIGGGTPFVIEAVQLEKIYKAVAETFPSIPEYTVEAGRPDVFSEEKLMLSKEYGVTRICVNPQSLNDKTLAAIGRKHTAEQFFKAYKTAEKYGFDINVDLIAGLAEEGVKDFEYSLDEVTFLNPANITVHTLSLKSGAKLKENVKRLNVSGIANMVNLSRDKLEAAGYSPYYMYRQKYQAGGLENVGWCKGGKPCVYNINVMEEISDNIAVGANAISKKLFGDENRIERLASPKDIPTYISKVAQIIADREKLFALM